MDYDEKFYIDRVESRIKRKLLDSEKVKVLEILNYPYSKCFAVCDYLEIEGRKLRSKILHDAQYYHYQKNREKEGRRRNK